MQRPEGTVKTWLNKALQLLRTHIESIDNPNDLDRLMISDLNGIGLSVGISHSLSENIEVLDKKTILRNRFDIDLSEGHLFPDKVILEASTSVGGKWKFELPIDHTRFSGMKEVIDVHEVVNVHDQQFEVEQVIIFPTRIAVKIRIDSENDMQIFDFTDLKLVNDIKYIEFLSRLIHHTSQHASFTPSSF